MTNIAILTGRGRDADPWHHLPGTTRVISEILSSIGDVSESFTDEDCTSVLEAADLVVVNAAADDSNSGTPGDHHPIVDRLLASTAQGAGILAIHSATLAFSNDPRWADLLGGRWVRGKTFHPQIGRALIQLNPRHPLVSDHLELVVYDERYSALDVAPDVETLGFHTEDGVVHTIAWTRRLPTGRVSYWGLGHGVESYENAEHRTMLRSLASWTMAA